MLDEAAKLIGGRETVLGRWPLKRAGFGERPGRVPLVTAIGWERMRILLSFNRTVLGMCRGAKAIGRRETFRSVWSLRRGVFGGAAR